MHKMTLGYYPGCSGLGTSLEYDMSTRAVCKALGINMVDIPDWTCCGSTPTHTVDRVLAAAVAARNFAQAERAGVGDVITPCPSCLKNLRNALVGMEDDFFRARVEALTERPLLKPHTVRSVLQVLVEDIGFETIKAGVTRPLTGLKVVPYYGCLMSRPAEVMQFDNPENPMSLDRLLKTLGAEVLPFSMKVECCGASMSIPARDIVPRLGNRILAAASEVGADCVVVACPLCQMNLDLRQGQINRANKTKYKLPVPYFTQLLGHALGLPESELGLSKLILDVQPLLHRPSARTITSKSASKPGPIPQTGGQE